IQFIWMFDALDMLTQLQR
ncbi:unnamed protein product, partial [Cuscuta campestris]